MRIIGFDPGIAIGKPVAIVAIDDAYHPGCPMPGDDPTPWVQLLGHAPKDKLDGMHWRRTTYIRSVLRAEIDRWAPDLIAVEDSYTRNFRNKQGERTFPLHAIVQYVMDWCTEWSVSCVTVNPQTVKAAFGKKKPEIAKNIRLLVRSANKLPRGYDWTDACAVALCGKAALLLKQQREEQG